jgi:hypothetical protein
VQRSRIAANISNMAALIFRKRLPAMPHDLASRLNQPAEHGLHLGVLAFVSGRRAASRTGRGAMIGDLPRGGSPLRLFCLPGGPPERSRRLLQPVAGRRLGAIQTVQSEPALEFGDPRRWSRAPGSLRRDRSD